MRRTLLAALASLAASAPAVADTEQVLPTAQVAFTISNDDCVSVNADGPSWQECGFQSFAMNEDGTRVLTVSAHGMIQLWDEHGQQLQKVAWGDQPAVPRDTPMREP